MVRIDYYISRIAHLLVGSALLTVAVHPYVSDGHLTLPKWFTAAAAGVALFTGLYNAGAVRPSRMPAANARWYRVVIYGGKTLLLVGMTPLLNKAVGNEMAAPARLALVVVSVMVGSYARYYREEALGMAVKTD